MTHHSTPEQPLKILIIDDHRLLLSGTIALVRDRFPDAQIFSACSAKEALAQVRENLPNLVIADLSIPETSGSVAHIKQGLGLLKGLMQDYPDLNLMVQSSNIKALIRILPEIDDHHGGFTIADKSLPVEAFLMRMEWAMQGLTHTKDIQSDLEVKPEWSDLSGGQAVGHLNLALLRERDECL